MTGRNTYVANGTANTDNVDLRVERLTLNPIVEVRGPWRLLPVVLVLGLCTAHNLKSREWGFSGRALLPALLWSIALTVPIVAALWFAGHAMGPAPVRRAVLLAAAIFASLHLPNPFLTIVTFTGGLAWSGIYSRHPNIMPLALSHAAATVVTLMSFDPALTGGLRIGWRYLQPR